MYNSYLPERENINYVLDAINMERRISLSLKKNEQFEIKYKNEFQISIGLFFIHI